MYDNKNIYHFPNSNKAADPLELRRKLIIHTQDQLSELIKLYNEGSDYDKAVAEDQLIAAARKTFQLAPITEPNGFSDDTVMDYLAHYLEWLSKPLEKNISYPPTYRPCTNC